MAPSHPLNTPVRTRTTDKVDIEHFFELDDGGGHDLRGHNLELKDQRSRLQLRQGFFS